MNRTEILDFDPTVYSKEECSWLLENLDKPAPVALASIKAVRLPPNGSQGQNKNGVIYPDGVNPNAMRPLLNRVQELEDFQTHNGQKWVGKEAIKEAIRVWLAVDAKWEMDNRRTRGRAPRFPSLFSFDARGKGHFGGPGSDNGKINTYFGPDGERRRLAINLIPEEAYEWVPNYTEKPVTSGLKDGLVVNADLHRIECFCGHTESFREGNRSSHNAARARMSKHLRLVKEEVERHRELYTLEFKG